MHELCPLLILLGVNVGILFSSQVYMKGDADQVSFLSDLYAPEIGPIPASRVDLHPGQAELAFAVICDPVCATDHVGHLRTVRRLCHMLADGLEEGREGTQGFRGREEEPRGSA